MRRLGKILRWATAMVACVVMLAIITIAAVTRTASFRGFLRAQVQTYFANSYKGRLAIQRVQGSVLGNLELLGVALYYGGGEVASARKIHVRYRLWSLIYATFSVERLEIDGLRVRAVEDGRHRWNLLEAVSERASTPSASASPIRILLASVQLRRARVSVAFANGKVYRMAGAELDGRIKLLPRGTVADITRLGANLIAPRLPPCTVDASFVYQDAATPASVRVRFLRLASPGLSKIELSGAVTNLDTLALDATLDVERLSGVDIKRFVPRWSKSAALRGTIRATGDRAGLDTAVAIASGRAKISGKVRVSLIRKPFDYSAMVKLADVDISRLVALEDFAGVINGSAQVAGSGTEPRALQGHAELRLAGVIVKRWRVGEVSLSTGIDAGAAKFDALVSDGYGGSATSSGELRFIGRLAYKFALAVKNLRIGTIESTGIRERGNVDFTASVAGEGVKLATMNSQAVVDLHRSTLGRVGIDRGALAARISKGRIEIAHASLQAGATEASARGVISATGERRGKFNYRLRTADIGPWLALAGRRGAGSLKVDGTVEGEMTDLRVRGDLSASRFQFAGIRIGSGQVNYDLSGVGRGIPSGRLNADVKTLKAVVELKSARLGVEIAPDRPAIAQISLEVVDASARPQRLVADVRYESGTADGRILALTLEMPDGKWQLARVASFHYDTSGTRVSDFGLVNGNKRIALDAEIARSGEQNVMLAIQNFNLADVDDLLANRYQLGGNVSGQTRITGTAMAPTIISQMEVDSPKVRGVALAGLSANLSYESGIVAFRVIARQDSRRELQADGALPVALRWDTGFQARPSGTIKAHVHSSEIDLAFLRDISPREARDIQGRLSIDVTINGPLGHPAPNGQIRLQDAKVVVRPLGVRISSMSAYLGIEPGMISLKEFSARSGDGVLRMSGAVALSGYRPRNFTVDASFNKWPAVNITRYQATIGGTVNVSGSPAAATVKGKIEVLKATVRPQLAFLEAGSSVKPDATIVVIRPGEAKPVQQTPSASIAAVNAYTNLAVNMDVRVHRDTWIRLANSYAELRGDVQVMKRPDGPITLVGSIETVRGSVEIAQQALTISQGQIYFTGGAPIDPSLNLVARREVPDYTVYASITGTASKPTLTLQSEPSLPQVDILSILMFGRPVTQLGQAQQASLQQQAVSIAGSYAASSVGQSIARSLGLGALNLSVEAGRAEVGRYVTENIYVSASQSFSPGAPQTPGQSAQQASIRYYITPHLDLQTSTSRTASNINLNWRFQY